MPFQLDQFPDICNDTHVYNRIWTLDSHLPELTKFHDIFKTGTLDNFSRFPEAVRTHWTSETNLIRANGRKI